MVDGAGNLFIADSANNRVQRVDAVTGIVTSISPGNQGVVDGVAVDASGNVYYSTYIGAQSSYVWRWNAASNTVSRYAGINAVGYSGDGGPATSAKLYRVIGMTVDGAGNLYMADCINSVVRRVDAITGIITTVAGNGTRGYAGDGGAATSGELSYPSGVAFDGAGNLYIADSGNNRVRMVTATTGIISTVVGTGVAGYSGDGGPATAAELGASTGIAPSDSCCGIERRLDVAADSAGDLYLADAGNKVIRWVNAKTGIITTVAGNGSTAPVDSVPATQSGLNYPTGVALDQQGNLYIADQSNATIRKVNNSQSSLSFPVTVVGQTATAQSLLLNNAGSATLAVSGISITGPNAGDFQQTSSCGASIAAGSSCAISLTFTPAAVGTRTATVNIVDNTGGTAGSVQTISLAGTGTP